MKLSENKEIVIIIGIMILFAIIVIISFSWFYNKPNNINNQDSNKNNTNQQNGKVIPNNNNYQNNEFVSCTTKLADTIIYTASQCIIKITEEDSLITKLPKINLKGSDVQSLNNSLDHDFKRSINNMNFLKYENKQIIETTEYFDYIFYSGSKFLSLIIEKNIYTLDSHRAEPQYRFYNFDIVDGSLLSNDDVIYLTNINFNQQASLIIGTIKQIYLDKFGYNIDGENKEINIDYLLRNINRGIFKDIYINEDGLPVIIAYLPDPYFQYIHAFPIELGSGYAKYKDKIM